LCNGVVSERFELIPRQHTQLMLPMIEELMASAGLGFSDLDAIAFGKGPGSFTGLRIAAGVAQGLAFAADLPVLPVSTLAAVAAEAADTSRPTLVFSCLDARIDEIYWGWYQVTDGQPQLLGDEQLCRPEAVPVLLPVQSAVITAAGNGMAYQERLPTALRDRFITIQPDLLPRSSYIVRLAAALWLQGGAIAPENVNPVYLRDKVTHN
jgi:tRNA threonylcarbamoyladenosine biosynthesis protein TsaB